MNPRVIKIVAIVKCPNKGKVKNPLDVEYLSYRYCHSGRLDGDLNICAQDMKKTEDEINNIKKYLIEVENYQKPLKSLSSYKLKDLIEFCEEVKIPFKEKNGKNLKKKDLYFALSNLFMS